jgi:hypothetical protein
MLRSHDALCCATRAQSQLQLADASLLDNKTIMGLLVGGALLLLLCVPLRCSCPPFLRCQK